MLAFVSGVVGGHKLYLNDTGGFIMYMVLFFVGIKIFGMPLSLILAIFEGLRLLNSSDQDFDRQQQALPAGFTPAPTLAREG